GARKLLTGNIDFKIIHIQDAQIHTEIKSDKSYDYHVSLKLEQQKARNQNFQLPSCLDPRGATIKLENVHFTSIHPILNKSYELNINELNASYEKEGKTLAGGLSMDVLIGKLGFNTLKGAYLKGAEVRGSPSFTLDSETGILEIPDFPFSIENQEFQLKANLNIPQAKYSFQLKNSSTDYSTVRRLLADSIASKLYKYNIVEPFDSSLDLSGKFLFGDNPNIYGEFSTQNNSIVIKDSAVMSQVNFSGHLTNDVYPNDSLRLANRTKQDIKLYFDQFSANLEDIEVNVENAYFQSTPEAKNYIHANLNLQGSNEALAAALKNDNFDFKGGEFSLDAIIDGDVSHFEQIFNNATGTFNLADTRVVFKKNKLQLPIENIDLVLAKENSVLNEFKIKLPNGNAILITGSLTNASSLIANNPVQQTQSRVQLNSPNLDLRELISMVTELIPQQREEIEDRKNLHQTFKALFEKFHPEFTINLNTLNYKDIEIEKIRGRMELVGPETVVLENFSFNYLGAETNLRGSLRVPKPEAELQEPIFIDARATSSGSIEVFREIFEIELFRFDSGEFSFNGNVTGNVQRLRQFLRNASGDLKLTDVNLYYPPGEINVAFDSLELFVDNSDILLRDVELEIGEHYPITVNGSIKEFPSFLLENTGTEGAISLKVDAPYIDGDKILNTVSSMSENKNADKVKAKKSLYTVFNDLNKFNPEIELLIDSLKYKELITKNINAKAFFENDSLLKLNNLDITYKNTDAKITGQVSANQREEVDISEKNPFDFNFNINVAGKTEDLNDYLQTINFVFESGNFEFNGSYSGQTEDLDILTANAYGDLKIDSSVVDYGAIGVKLPLDSLHLVIDNNLASLKTLDVNLPGKSSIQLSGEITNFSNFINNLQIDESHYSDFLIESPYLSSKDIRALFKSNQRKEKDSTAKDLDLTTFKNALKNINTSYRPEIKISIDSLVHDKLYFTDFGAEISFDEEQDFHLSQTEILFHGGSLRLDFEANLKTDGRLPVNIDMDAENIDIHEVVSRLDYFGDKDLKNADSINGILSYKLNGKVAFKNNGNVDLNSLNGTLDIQLDSLAIFNYKPIMENSVLMKDERFKELRFRPINMKLEVVNGEIIIPRTQIQSTAFHLFVEGKVKLEEYVNVWLSLPWSNLKSREGTVLPEKETYEEAGSKFYIQIVKDETAEKERKRKLRFKFRLGKRKMRKGIGKPD
ncbi:MAG: AsmA-like C-terminal region-containing protein, partial [Flavobacteriaceae bacterium]|nr:AsmA-like C-terminal region-containing protein [Flavobacteriaceae bacterium]